MSQRCHCQRCNITICTIAITALCSFSLSQRWVYKQQYLDQKLDHASNRTSLLSKGLLVTCLATWPLSLSPCARSLTPRLVSVTSHSIRLGDVTETNRTQAPKQQTTGNWRSYAGTRQVDPNK